MQKVMTEATRIAGANLISVTSKQIVKNCGWHEGVSEERPLCKNL